MILVKVELFGETNKNAHEKLTGIARRFFCIFRNIQKNKKKVLTL